MKSFIFCFIFFIFSPFFSLQKEEKKLYYMRAIQTINNQKENIMKKLFSILLFLFLTGMLFSQEWEVKFGNAVIFAPRQHTLLAKDLQLHLEKISGKKIAIYKNKSLLPKGKFVFDIGTNPDDRTYKAQEEGVYKATANALYFHGEGNYGTSHAVYKFLEDDLGVRWPSRRVIIAPRFASFKLKAGEKNVIPKLNLRTIRGLGIWGNRLRFGGHDRPSYGHAFTKWWPKYGKTNPEYFALNYGKRQPCSLGEKSGDLANVFSPAEIEKIALCVSSHAVVDQIIANWNKKSLYINICENDAPSNLSCHCKDCMALDVLTPEQQKDWTHALADRYIVFANRVLEKARKYRKDVKVSMYAYNATQDAPRKVKPDPAVVIGIVPTDFSMEGITKYVGDWKKMGLNTFYYRPNRHFYYSHSLPCGYEKHFYNVMKYLIKENAIGFDYDAPGYYKNAKAYKGNPHTDFSDYLLAKTMEDPSKSFEYWEAHYLSSFGKAAPEMKKYFHYWRKNVWEKRISPNLKKITDTGKFYNFGRGLYMTLGSYYKETDFIESGKFLAAALKKPLTADQKAFVESLVEFHNHASLTFNAITKKTDASSLELLRYREKHNHELMPWSEIYYGDVCGIKRVINFREYTAPFVKLPLFWKFKLDPNDVGIKEKWFTPGLARKWKEHMPVNRAWEKPYSHYRFPSKELRAKMVNYNGIGWYAASIKVPADWKDRKVYLYFGAVDESAWIYCNGKESGKHLFINPDDWSTPFAIDITKDIDWNKKVQEIVVRVEDKNGAGGIWKEVYLLSKKK